MLKRSINRVIGFLPAILKPIKKPLKHSDSCQTIHPPEKIIHLKYSWSLFWSYHTPSTLMKCNSSQMFFSADNALACTCVFWWYTRLWFVWRYKCCIWMHFVENVGHYTIIAQTMIHVDNVYIYSDYLNIKLHYWTKSISACKIISNYCMMIKKLFQVFCDCLNKLFFVFNQISLLFFLPGRKIQSKNLYFPCLCFVIWTHSSSQRTKK